VQLVDELALAGAVARERNERNRRANLVQATDEGRALLRRLGRSAAASDKAVTARLDADETAMLRALLTRLVAA